jgi:hypothetical protein
MQKNTLLYASYDEQAELLLEKTTELWRYGSSRVSLSSSMLSKIMAIFKIYKDIQKFCYILFLLKINFLAESPLFNLHLHYYIVKISL